MISWNGKARVVVADGRPIRCRSVEAAEGGWIAEVGVGRGSAAELVTSSPESPQVRMRLWSDTGRPLAAVGTEGRPAGLAVIPMCSCGDPGCTASGRQADAVIPAGRVGALLDLLGDLPVVGTLPDGSDTWDLGELLEG